MPDFICQARERRICLPCIVGLSIKALDEPEALFHSLLSCPFGMAGEALFFLGEAMPGKTPVAPSVKLGKVLLTVAERAGQPDPPGGPSACVARVPAPVRRGGMGVSHIVLPRRA